MIRRVDRYGLNKTPKLPEPALGSRHCSSSPAVPNYSAGFPKKRK